jgi:hypothetical protein
MQTVLRGVIQFLQGFQGSVSVVEPKEEVKGVPMTLMLKEPAATPDPLEPELWVEEALVVHRATEEQVLNELPFTEGVKDPEGWEEIEEETVLLETVENRIDQLTAIRKEILEEEKLLRKEIGALYAVRTGLRHKKAFPPEGKGLEN